MMNLHKYEFKGVPFASWLYRIAKSEVYTAFRKEQAKRTVNMDTAGLGDMVEDMEEDKYGPYLDVLKESVTDLEEEDMQFVEMRFFEKRAFKEIADIFGITENNAKVKTYRILEKLKKIIVEKARLKKQSGQNIA
jgi:RNA polymerase sigma-70 factor (ECF subfamily)